MQTMTPLKTQAIQTALLGDWNSAISLNQELLKDNPNDIETLNRLALAYTALGKFKEAKILYQKALMLDNQNLIAIKNLKRLSETKKIGMINPHAPLASNINSLFLEENGKTKIVELINIAQPNLIMHLMTRELLTLQIKRLKIFVLDSNKQYIGMLPDDIGKRLIKFLKGGNTYEVCVKAAQEHKVTVFIRETKRVTRFKNQPSFIATEKTKMTITKNHSSEEADDDDEDNDSDS